MNNENIDEFFMRQALNLAKIASNNGEVPIGALIVDNDNNIIAQGYNMPINNHDPSGHAEIIAIREAGQKLQNYRLKPNLRLYVTLEPCTMCAGAISFARIDEVIFGAQDKKGGAIINGAKFFESETCHFRPKIKHSILENECSLILKQFFADKRKK